MLKAPKKIHMIEEVNKKQVRGWPECVIDGVMGVGSPEPTTQVKVEEKK